MKRTASIAVAFLVTVALGAPSAAAWEQGQGRGQGQSAKPKTPDQKPGKPAAKKDKDKTDKADKKDDNDVTVVFDRDRHTRVIHDYRTAGLPPGLAKRESLPPGLRQQLRERGELPPGLQKHLVAVPAPLASRLPAVPRYYQRYFAGDDLVVVDTRNHTIVAIVWNVLR